MLFSLRSGYRNAAVLRIGTGNRTIPEFLLFRESVTLRGTDPTLRRACGTRAVRGSTGWQEACKRLVAVRNAGSAALRKTYGRANRFPGTGLHSFFPNGYGRAVRAGYSGQSPILVRARHTGKSGVSTPFYRAAGKTIRPYLLFPRPVR